MTEFRDIWMHAHNMIRSARQIINENLQPLNLSSAEGNILLHLLTQGEEMGQEQLVEQLDVSKPAVSRSVDSLEKKGFVIRKQDPDDKRAHRVRLTDKAVANGSAIEQAYNRVYALAMRGISQDEMETFLRIFARISENFTQEDAEKKKGTAE